MNTAVRTTLGLPLLRRLLGRTFAVITVTGAETGRRYTTPVQYMRLGGDYGVLSQRHRRWWRNLRTIPEVSLPIGDDIEPADIQQPSERMVPIVVCGDDSTGIPPRGASSRWWPAPREIH